MLLECKRNSLILAGDACSRGVLPLSAIPLPRSRYSSPSRYQVAENVLHLVQIASPGWPYSPRPSIRGGNKTPYFFFFFYRLSIHGASWPCRNKYCSPACYISFPLVQLGTRIGTGPEGRTQAIYFRIPNALQCSKLGGYPISLDFLHYFIASFLSCCRHRNNWTTGFSIRVNST